MNTSSPAHIVLLRVRIAAQRKAIADQCAALMPRHPPRTPQRSGSVAGIVATGLVIAFIASHQRTRTALRATVSAGWLVWRAAALLRALASAFGVRSTRP
jgi:hypothetical protein